MPDRRLFSRDIRQQPPWVHRGSPVPRLINAQDCSLELWVNSSVPVLIAFIPSLNLSSS